MAQPIERWCTRRWSSLSALALTACLPAPPPAPVPPEVTPYTAEVATDRLPEAVLRSYLGTFRSGGDTIIIARAGPVLTATRDGGGGPLKLIGLGTFTDTAGTSYLFTSGTLNTLSPDGQRRRWSR